MTAPLDGWNPDRSTFVLVGGLAGCPDEVVSGGAYTGGYRFEIDDVFTPTALIPLIGGLWRRDDVAVVVRIVVAHGVWMLFTIRPRPRHRFRRHR